MSHEGVFNIILSLTNSALMVFAIVVITGKQNTTTDWMLFILVMMVGGASQHISALRGYAIKAYDLRQNDRS